MDARWSTAFRPRRCPASARCVLPSLPSYCCALRGPAFLIHPPLSSFDSQLIGILSALEEVADDEMPAATTPAASPSGRGTSASRSAAKQPKAKKKKKSGSRSSSSEGEDDDDYDDDDDDDDESEEEEEEEEDDDDEEEEDGDEEEEEDEVADASNAGNAEGSMDDAASRRAISSVLHEQQQAFVDACIDQYRRQGPEGHVMLESVLKAIGTAIDARADLQLHWLKEGVIDKCVPASDLFGLGALPEGLVKNDATYTQLVTERDRLHDSLEPGALNEAEEAVVGQQIVADEKIRAWRAAQEDLSKLESRSHELVDQEREKQVRLEWHERALKSAKSAKAPKKSSTAAPPPSPRGAGGASSAASIGALSAAPKNVERIAALAALLSPGVPMPEEGGAVGRIDWLDGQLSATGAEWTGSSGSIPDRLTAIEAAVANLPKAPGVLERFLQLEKKMAGSKGSPKAAQPPAERVAWLDEQLGIKSEGRIPERLDAIQAEMDDQGYA